MTEYRRILHWVRVTIFRRPLKASNESVLPTFRLETNPLASSICILIGSLVHRHEWLESSSMKRVSKMRNGVENRATALALTTSPWSLYPLSPLLPLTNLRDWKVIGPKQVQTCKPCFLSFPSLFSFRLGWLLHFGTLHSLTSPNLAYISSVTISEYKPCIIISPVFRNCPNTRCPPALKYLHSTLP